MLLAVFLLCFNLQGKPEDSVECCSTEPTPRKGHRHLGCHPFSCFKAQTRELGAAGQSFSFLSTQKRQIKSQKDGQAGVKIMPTFLFGFLSLLCVPQLSAQLLPALSLSQGCCSFSRNSPSPQPSPGWFEGCPAVSEA